MAVPVLETQRLLLTPGAPEAAARYLAYAVDNEPRLAPLEPLRPPGYFTEAYWQKRLEQNREELDRDVSCRMGIFYRSDPGGRLVGQANLTNFIRGCAHTCMLGYSLDARAVGQGIMTEALAALVAFAFGPLRFHRIQANYMPSNERSGSVLRRLGFVVEGYARSYLFIGGAWRDHILTAKLNPALPDPA